MTSTGAAERTALLENPATFLGACDSQALILSDVDCPLCGNVETVLK